MSCKKCEIKKEDNSIIEELKAEEKRFSFPKEGKVIVASSLEEAIKKLEALKSKK